MRAAGVTVDYREFGSLVHGFANFFPLGGGSATADGGIDLGAAGPSRPRDNRRGQPPVLLPVATKENGNAKYDLKAADRKRNLAVQIGLTAVVVIFAVALVLYIVMSGRQEAGSRARPSRSGWRRAM